MSVIDEIREMIRGERVRYYVGMLASDSFVGPLPGRGDRLYGVDPVSGDVFGINGRQARARRRIARLASEYQRAERDGLVTLHSVRIAEGVHAYWATRTEREG